MNKTFFALIVSISFAMPGAAQTNTLNRPFLQASGDGSVSIRPDLMRINVGVTTQGRTAQEAAEMNAARLTEVMAALRQLLGQTADIKTISYSVTPNYKYPAGGGEPTITGYTANNTIQVSTADLSAAGKIIDVAAKSGSNTISGLSFTLADPEPARQDALKLASKQARVHVEAMAQALNLRVGSIMAVQEGFTSRIVPLTADRTAAGGAAAVPTPVEPGSLEIGASVTLQAEIIQ